MAKISLVNIPNAPAMPEGTPMIRLPRVNFDGGAAARQLTQSPLAENAFDGPARGLAAIGNAVGRGGEELGSTLGDITDKLAKAKNVADATAAETTMRDFIGTRQDEIRQQFPPSQWQEQFTKSLPELQKKLDGLGTTRSGAEEVAQTYMRLVGGARVDLNHASRLAVIDQSRTTLTNAMNAAVKEKRYGDAEHIVRRGSEVEAFGAGEAHSMTTAIRTAERGDRFANYLEADPWALRAMMADARAGKATALGDVTEQDEAHYEPLIEQTIRQRQQQATSAIDRNLISGDGDEAATRAAAEEARLPENVMESFVRSRNIRPARTFDEAARYLENSSLLQTAVESYDPSQDLDGSRQAALRMQVRESLPPGERGGLFDALDEHLSRGINATTRKRAASYRSIDGATDLLMRAAADSSGFVKPEDAMQIWTRAGMWKELARTSLQSHPDLSLREVGQLIGKEMDDETRRGISFQLFRSAFAISEPNVLETQPDLR